MKKGIKAEILQTAIRLFGEKGYNQVSMRDIANALQISVGNLTYHFKKKEDLVDAAIREKHKSYEKPQAVRSLRELNDYFVRLFEHYRRSAYYFRHYTQLAQVCPSVYKMQTDVMRDMYGMLMEAVQGFIGDGLMDKEEMPGQHSGMVQALMTVCVHGIPPVGGVGEVDAKARLHCIWGVIYPTLTRQGKIEFEKLGKH